MRIGFTYPFNRLWQEQSTPFMKKYGEHEFVTDRETIVKEIESFQLLVCGIEPKEMFDRAKSMEAVFIPFVGIDHLPQELFLQRGIRVFNSHGNARFVAERTLALVLCCAGRIHEYHRDLSRGIWHGWVGKGSSDTWESIVGSTVAILGTGAIATWTARYLKVFDCKIYGYKKRRIEQHPSEFDSISYELEEVLSAADIVISTLPLTEETKGLLGKKQMPLLQGKILVNVGRGEVIDEEALYYALKDGIVKAAGIDTWYTYPTPGNPQQLPGRFPFQELPNLVLSPHIGGFTPKAIVENIQVTLSNIDAYLSGRPVPNEVDLLKMY